MKNLDLFDNISYKYIKDIINNDDDDIEVEIEDLDCDKVAWCKTRFTFKLNIDVSGGSMPIMVDKEFVVEKEYNNSSAYALMMIELNEEEEEPICCAGCGKDGKFPENRDGDTMCECCMTDEEEEEE